MYFHVIGFFLLIFNTKESYCRGTKEPQEADFCLQTIFHTAGSFQSTVSLANTTLSQTHSLLHLRTFHAILGKKKTCCRLTFRSSSLIFSASLAAQMCQRAPGFSLASYTLLFVISSTSPSSMVVMTSEGPRMKKQGTHIQIASRSSSAGPRKHQAFIALFSDLKGSALSCHHHCYNPTAARQTQSMNTIFQGR